MTTPEHHQASSSGAPGGGRRRRRILHVVAVAVVAVCVAAAGVVGIARDTTSSDDEATPPTSPPPSLSIAPPTAPPAAFPEADGPGVSAAALRRELRPLLSSRRLGRHVAYAFATLDGGGPLLSTGDLVTPASTLKLLTAATVLLELGPDHRFETRVVREARTHRIVLVGGGDPLLTGRAPTPDDAFDDYPKPATLAALARSTAHALTTSGIHRVSLSYDGTLFAGPAVSPRWEPSYIPESIVSPISALWVDEGRERPGFVERSANPGHAAAGRFAALLRVNGIQVGHNVVAARAPSSATELAAVSSAPLAQIVEHTLDFSDNEAAEVLLRQAAIAAGRRGSFAGGVAVLRSAMQTLGVGLRAARIYDGSGLSRDDRVPVDALVEILQAAARPDAPDLRPLLTGLAVAGFTGSLSYRFVDDAPRGLGVVRAKTGTLTGVHGLAGVAATVDGEPLVFAVVADDVPVRRTLAARAQLDRIAAAITSLGSS